MSAFRLAHCSDPHLAYESPWPGLPGLLSKRTLSRISWARGRRALQRPEVLAAAIADIRAQAPQHLLISGDLTNFSLPGEFAAAARWLEGLGSAADISVVPGNHDALVTLPWADSLAHWQPWFGGAIDSREAFPYLRRLGEDVALVGLSSALPTAPGFASGELGAAQLQKLEALLRRLGDEGLARIVSLHHPPADGVVRARKALRDRAALRAVLARSGAELVLHGHSRDARFDPVPGPQGLIPVLGVPSISAIPNPKDEGARWHLFELSRAGAGWVIDVTARRIRASLAGFETAARYRLC
ncbi:MAG: metallophosphoesterase [Nevskia sp.]